MFRLDTKHYQNQTLVEVAYKALKKDITERTLVPGEKIILRELHERYGISETPIKQALNRLITEGLIENIPRKGVKVKSIKWEDIEELLDIRMMIETYYIQHIIQTFKDNPHIKDDFIKNITEHKRIIEYGTGVNDYFQNYSLDQEFHQMFVKCSGNKRIVQIYSNLGTHAYAYYIYGKQSKEETIAGVEEHEAIFNALVTQNETELRRCIEMHIVNAKNKINKNIHIG
ncbi:hypothetical protein SY88_05145 [Clostridiales bacterium PH28_bin88]|nr:hypothetical protein SY88_05145 [Clostridiales bacterium PH28_bin88]